MTTTAKKYFFKVFFPDKHFERMVIPSAFVKSTLRRRIPEDVILRNVSGRVWCVKTRLVGRKIYFQEGWKVFQAENCIRKSDFLLFKYDGTNVFKVVILEQSSRCERREVEEDEVINITEEEENEKAEDSMMEDEEDNDDEDDYYEDDDGNYTEIEESEEEHMSSQNHHRDSAPSSMQGPHLEDYEFDPQMYIQPENPYFEAKLYKNRPNELHVPANIIRDSSLTFPEEITLSRCQCFQREDIQRNEFRDSHFGLSRHTPIYSEVKKVSEWQDGRVCIKGWTSFCTKNKIKENDVCICEIVPGKDRVVRALQVHVLGARNG